MAQTVLGNVSLGYQFIWNSKRQPRAVRLFVNTSSEVPVDAKHLLNSLIEFSTAKSPQLLLSIESPALFRELIQHMRSDSPWLEVPEASLHDPYLVAQIQLAKVRGAKLIWRGAASHAPEPSLDSCFYKRILSLNTGEVLLSLHAAWHARQTSGGTDLATSPVLSEQIYESVASRLLAEHCLDQQGVWGIVGWPSEEILMGYRNQMIQPSASVIEHLLQSIGVDQSMETIEQLLFQEPVLVYRYLIYANSAGLGLRAEVGSVRQGLMVMGLTALREWLISQLPFASQDANLNPLRFELLTRAKLMANLLDSGEEDELRREVYLCGLFSNIQGLLGEPLSQALGRLPLPQRLLEALLHQSGPYAPYLRIVNSLSDDKVHETPAFCNLYQISIEEVNRSLLRTLLG